MARLAQRRDALRDYAEWDVALERPLRLPGKAGPPQPGQVLNLAPRIHAVTVGGEKCERKILTAFIFGKMEGDPSDEPP